MGHLLSGPVSTALQKQASQVQRLEGRAVYGALVTTMTLVSRSPSCYVIMYTRLHLVLSSSYFSCACAPRIPRLLRHRISAFYPGVD